MRPLPLLMAPIAFILLWLCLGCDSKPSAQLQGQTNVTLRFYGLAVDQDGVPLKGARVQYQVDAYPKDWTFETRGRPYDTTVVAGVSDTQGRFAFDVTGCILRLKSADRQGYRHFFEMDQADGQPSGLAYRLIAWSDQQYRSDQNHPAVFVFVKDGISQVSALPSRGGFQASGKQWIPNVPAWPKKPSLKDVVYKPSSTQPTSQP
jgi:hypothetical protein